MKLAISETHRLGYVLRDVQKFPIFLQTMVRLTVWPRVHQTAMLIMRQECVLVTVQVRLNKHLLTIALTCVLRFVRPSLITFLKIIPGPAWMFVHHPTICMLTIRQGSVCIHVQVMAITLLLTTKPGCVSIAVQTHPSKHSMTILLKGAKQAALLVLLITSLNSVYFSVQIISMVRLLPIPV